MTDFIFYAFCFIWGSIYILFSEAVDRNLDEAKALHDDCQRILDKAYKLNKEKQC